MLQGYINITLLVRLCGLAQIVLVVASLSIPKILNWREELCHLQPLLKQMFWTYAWYILVINLCFGFLSVFDYRELINGTTLSMLVCGFIAFYWLSRILIQFFYFDRSNFPKGIWFTMGETALVSLFTFLTIIYSVACYVNYQHIAV